MRAVVVLLLPLGALSQATGPCTISGIACPYEHTDTDQDYTHIDSSDQWVWSGTTSDGRAWYESDDVDSSVKYLYYSTRAEGWLLTYTAPDLSADDPWVTSAGGGGTGGAHHVIGIGRSSFASELSSTSGATSGGTGRGGGDRRGISNWP